MINKINDLLYFTLFLDLVIEALLISLNNFTLFIYCVY